MSTKIFVNLSVNDLEASKAFYTKLGFTINPQFTNENAACVVISDTIYVMILTKAFFKGFTKKIIIDASTSTEALFAISVESRAEVSELTKRALAAGGETQREPEDHGWMYSESFQDLDGHIWEAVWMDESHIEKA